LGGFQKRSDEERGLRRNCGRVELAGLAFGGFADGEYFCHFFDVLLAGLGLFGAVYPVDVFLFVGVGEGGEGFGDGG
jgi:hypothetical protein